MSVLLNLPNDLFYHIVIEWIDPTLFLAFTHLDNAVKFDSNLRLTLLNHYEANCKNFPYLFEWKGGYYCESQLEIEEIANYLPSFVGIRIVVKLLNLDEYTEELVDCILNSSIMTSLSLRRDLVLRESNRSGLSYLKSLHIDYRYEATLEGCLCIRNSCFKLIRFSAGCNRASAEVRQVLNEIVANNHNLEYLTVFTTNDIFNILPVNCKLLREVTLYIEGVVEVKSIYDLIEALPLLGKFILHSKLLDCDWIYCSDYCKNMDFGASTGPVSLQWNLHGMNTSYLNDVVTYFATTTTIFKIDLSSQTYCENEVQTLQRTILDCNNLSALELNIYKIHNDLIDILQPVAAKLQKLKVFQCKVANVIELLKCCQNLTNVLFFQIRDESTEHPWVIEELKNTIAQYPKQSVDIFMAFQTCYANYSLSYKCGKFKGSRMDHYWK